MAQTKRRGCLRYWKWAVGGVVALVVLGALLPPPEEDAGGVEVVSEITATDGPTPTIAPSATITPTPLPTGTPDPVEVARQIIDRETVGGEVLSVVANDFAVVSRFEMNNTFGYDVDYTHGQMVQMLCDLREVFTDHRIILDGVITVVDGFGNESQQSGITVTFEVETVAQINCENEFNVNLPAIADEYAIDRLLR